MRNQGNNDTCEVAIIGAGPAGIAAALQLKRMGVDFVIFEKDAVGGLLKNANRVENYPGFPPGIPGPELVGLFKRQLRRAHIAVRNEEVNKLDFAGGRFLVETARGVLMSRLAVIASGTRPKEITDVEIPAAAQKRIYYEMHPLIKLTGKKIVIIGAGDAAFDYSLSLSGKNHVLILNRGERTKCLPVLYKKAMEVPRINYLKNISLTGIAADSREGVRMVCRGRRGFLMIRAEYVLCAVGRHPVLDFISKKITGTGEQLQRRRLLYVIGDVRGGFARQTAIAVGDGVRSAMEIGRRLCEGKR